jgi:hypothetical protein
VPWKRPPWERSSRALCYRLCYRQPGTRSSCASCHAHRFQSSRCCLQQPHFPIHSPVTTSCPADASSLTGYALHITELDVGVENAGDKGPPSTFGRFTVIRLEQAIREESGASFTTRVLIFCVYHHDGRKHALSMTYLTLTPGSGFQLHVVTVEERPRSMHDVCTVLVNGRYPLQATSIRQS